ncbi:MAG TPA: ATP-binding protein, partial [Pyrinomonadaceae bacterium]|nr:ATP-binding protein [Pyrinomonadaceae bacterium]
RNAVVHGVEPPEERRAAGKRERGRVRVEASGGGGRVRLRVSDDGRGVDPALVERAARSRGLAGEGERMTEERALRLIFRPGFTTAARASESSGRGVGLDVVERAVEDAGGEVRVRSRRGEGSTFELNLPARLALTRALFVRDGGRLYCVDSAHVLDVREAGVSEVERRGREEFVRPGVGDEVMRLVRLRELLGRDEGTKDAGGGDGGVAEGGKMTLVVTNAAGRGATGAEGASAAGGRVAVAVEAVEGRGEILVRGLGRHAGRWRGVAGATELRDGTVALLLDLQRLLE